MKCPSRWQFIVTDTSSQSDELKAIVTGALESVIEQILTTAVVQNFEQQTHVCATKVPSVLPVSQCAVKIQTFKLATLIDGCRKTAPLRLVHLMYCFWVDRAVGKFVLGVLHEVKKKDMWRPTSVCDRVSTKTFVIFSSNWV